jgi:GNAT superfamily N-acetyltransferase
MNILKRIQVLLLALFPACSCGMKKNSGTFPALDKKGAPIIFEGSPVLLEWHKITDHATMVELQKKVLPVVAEAFADEVKDFLLDEQYRVKKEYQRRLGIEEKAETQSDKIKEPIGENPFVATARLDRTKRVEFSRQQWEQWFATTAQSMKDIPFTYFFVVAKSGRGDILGFTAFYMSPKLTTFFPEFDVYTEGDVVLEPIAVTPKAQGIGLARPLVFSILRLAPEAKRILVGTRIWITNAIVMYNKLGFTEYKREGIGVKFKCQVKEEK